MRLQTPLSPSGPAAAADIVCGIDGIGGDFVRNVAVQQRGPAAVFISPEVNDRCSIYATEDMKHDDLGQDCALDFPVTWGGNISDLQNCGFHNPCTPTVDASFRCIRPL